MIRHCFPVDACLTGVPIKNKTCCDHLFVRWCQKFIFLSIFVKKNGIDLPMLDLDVPSVIYCSTFIILL